MKRHLLAAALSANLCACADPPLSSGLDEAGAPPPVMLVPELDPSQNRIPGHPGFVVFKYEDRPSKVLPAEDVPDSIKFVDGKPVVLIVFAGHCINQIGLDGVELRTTYMLPRTESPNPSGPLPHTSATRPNTGAQTPGQER